MAGTFSSLDIPGGTAAIYANGINNDGQIVGFYTDSSGGTHGFLATVDMTPPVIIVSDSPATLWPPSGQLVIVTVSGTITDEPNGSGVQANSTAYRVMDESGQIQPSGSFILADGGYAFTVALQASRRGSDLDGRQYVITVSAKDITGNPGSASATVTVPHN